MLTLDLLISSALTAGNNGFPGTGLMSMPLGGAFVAACIQNKYKNAPDNPPPPRASVGHRAVDFFL